MRPDLHAEDKGTASLQLMAPPPSAGADWARIHPAVARGIAGRAVAVADLVFLSLTLVYFALCAGAAQPSGGLWKLLSMKMTIGHFVLLAFCWVLWRTIFTYCGLYAGQHIKSAGGLFGRLVLATGLAALVAGESIAFEWHHGHLLSAFFDCWLAGLLCVLLVRVAVGAFHFYARPLLRRRRIAVIVGSGPRADRLREELAHHPEWRYEILGHLHQDACNSSESDGASLGRIADLESVLMRQVVDEVIVALAVKSNYATIERVIAACARVGVEVQYPEDLFDVPWSQQHRRIAQERRRVVVTMVQQDYRSRIKRALDVVGALTGLILFAPLFAAAAIAIKATSRGPVFFRQERYGLGRRIFRIIKFRTMVVNAESAQASLEHLNENTGPVFKIFKDPRITKVGRFLRRTSIDELPQLINVLKGEMSLVGPRPLNLRDVGRFSEAWLMRRFSMKPGLTCLWQISGRSNVSFDRWIALDLHYIDHWSLLMDWIILAKTIPAVVKGTGAA
ncbi:MAG TPA: sugar transferase [Terracidiphilus sp.]|nr:sugar transferase [Terracidiphilus sp.]